MHLLYYSHLLWVFVLIAFAVTGKASIVPQYHEDLAARIFVSPATV